MSYDCICDYDPPDVYHPSTRRARKQHKCDECAGHVEPGERYEHVFGVWEGSASTWRTCERCHDIRQWVKNNVPCLCWAHGSTIEDCKAAVEDAAFRAPAETIGLRFGFLRRVYIRDKFNAESRRSIAA